MELENDQIIIDNNKEEISNFDHIKNRMFASITSGVNDDKNIFYKSQQFGEEDLNKTEKISILNELFNQNRCKFLERYYNFINPEYISLFDESESRQKYYLDQIKRRKNGKINSLVRNLRYLAMQELKRKGQYFSNEKMRERDPYLFDLMVGPYLVDIEKLYLRPTIEINDSNRSEFSRMLEQFDESQRISDRKERFLDNYRKIIDNSDNTDRFIYHVSHRTVEADDEELQMKDEFEMEFDSSDEEGREAELFRLKKLQSKEAHHCAKKDETFVMKQFQRESDKLASNGKEESKILAPKEMSEKETIALSKMKVSGNKDNQNEGEEWSSGDEDESKPTGFSREQLYEEFISMMEERFLEGDDKQFFDYSQIDDGSNFDRIKDQDMEDEYFDSEEPD